MGGGCALVTAYLPDNIHLRVFDQSSVPVMLQERMRLAQRWLLFTLQYNEPMASVHAANQACYVFSVYFLKFFGSSGCQLLSCSLGPSMWLTACGV